jgi:hypothetical protein
MFVIAPSNGWSRLQPGAYVMPRGGHFAAMEEPGLLVEDVRKFSGD